MIGPIFIENTYSIYPKVLNFNGNIIFLGIKSYIESLRIDGAGLIQVGNFSSISSEIHLRMLSTDDHNYHNISSYSFSHLDWQAPKNLYMKHKSPFLKINIGSDVWIGMGCHFKVSNQDKPLNIGNGAVVAADSVVVKDVPPFAIVGGNPAKFIKWRFEPEIIEALQRIAWWNWDLEKIYDNFHLFKDPEEFVRIFDPQK